MDVSASRLNGEHIADVSSNLKQLGFRNVLRLVGLRKFTGCSFLYLSLTSVNRFHLAVKRTRRIICRMQQEPRCKIRKTDNESFSTSVTLDLELRVIIIHMISSLSILLGHVQRLFWLCLCRKRRKIQHSCHVCPGVRLWIQKRLHWDDGPVECLNFKIGLPHVSCTSNDFRAIVHFIA